MSLLFIALGGAAGALARYGLAGWVHTHASATFPWGTLVVNLTGAFVLGFAYRYLVASGASAEFRGFVTIGLLGAFTTFSTFSYEAAMLLQDGKWTFAGAYIIGSVALGVCGALAGLWLATVTLSFRGVA